MGTSRLLVAADQPLVASGVAATFEGRSDFEVIVVELDLESLPSIVDALSVDLCLLALTGGAAPFRPAVLALGSTLGCPLVVMTRQVPSRDVLFDAIGSGVRGWMTVEMDPCRLPAVLADVLAGNVALPRPAVTDLVEELRKRNALHLIGRDGRAVRLSAQEHRTLHLLSTGLSTAATAERMQVACVTVRGYVASASRKLGATSREDALEALAR